MAYLKMQQQSGFPDSRYKLNLKLFRSSTIHFYVFTH